jgi:hypothetical protein
MDQDIETTVDQLGDERDTVPFIDILFHARWATFVAGQRWAARDFLHQRVAAAYRRLGWDEPGR